MPQHHRAALHLAREDVVVFESRPHLVEHALELRDAFQFALPQLLKHAYARRFVALREHHVEADNGDAVFVEELVQQQCQPVARPRPAALATLLLLLQAFLVDIQDDHARIDSARHRQSQPGVIDNGLEIVEQRNAQKMNRMRKEHGNNRHANRYARQIFSHPVVLKRLCRNGTITPPGRGAHPLRHHAARRAAGIASGSAMRRAILFISLRKTPSSRRPVQRHRGHAGAAPGHQSSCR